MAGSKDAKIVETVVVPEDTALGVHIQIADVPLAGLEAAEIHLHAKVRLPSGPNPLLAKLQYDAIEAVKQVLTRLAVELGETVRK